jgi:putative component of membrane protein insertase Oxa1/YidC/SpoIIIJ protein YidD
MTIHGHLCFERPFHVLKSWVLNASMLLNLDNSLLVELPWIFSKQVSRFRSGLPIFVVCCCCSFILEKHSLYKLVHLFAFFVELFSRLLSCVADGICRYFPDCFLHPFHLSSNLKGAGSVAPDSTASSSWRYIVALFMTTSMWSESIFAPLRTEKCHPSNKQWSSGRLQ